MNAERLAEIEYDSLYKEIDKHSDRLFIILNFNIVAITTIFGFVFNMKPEAIGNHFNSTPILLLVPLVVVLPSFVLVTEELNAIARIAAYIRVFYEGRMSSIFWQQAVQCIRKEDKREVPTQFLRRALRILLPSLAGTCIILSILAGSILSFEKGDFYIFLFMLGPWAISVGLTARLRSQLGQTWQRDNIDRLSEIVVKCIK